MKWSKIIFMGLILIGFVACSKNENYTSSNIDGNYEGFIYNFSSKKTDHVIISLTNSLNKQMRVQSVQGLELDFFATKQADEDCCVKFNIITNDSIKGVPVANTCIEHLLYSKKCQCLNFKIILNGDTLAFASTTSEK